MKRFNYYVERNNDTNEIVYIEYDKLDGYKITPKTKKEDAISVNKIVFVSPSLTEKLIRKKVELRIKYLLSKLKDIESDDEGSGDAIRETLMESERLKLNILNSYLKYLGKEYASLSLKKLQIIINSLRYKLFSLSQRNFDNYNFYEEEKKGRGR